jgi:release factor glutamine methyltransferase
VTASSPEHVVRWRELVELARSRLREMEACDNPGQEARWLAERAGGFEPAELQLALNEPVTERSGTHFHLMLDRRLTGEPLQHVLGRWSFRTLELVVDNRVLIPRPETEVLAGMALEECERLDADLAVDLGTGSGAIALSLAVERPDLEVWATDVSSDALSVAKANLAGLGRRARGVRMVEGRWFDALPSELKGRIDVLVSNPPYVAPEEMDDLPAEVREYEPEVALVAPDRGMADIREILATASTWLARPGAVLLEMAPHQTSEAAGSARAAGFGSVSVWPDLAGRDRVLLARL